MAVTRIVANLPAPDPIALAKSYEEVFELELPFEMGWIAFLSKDATPAGCEAGARAYAFEIRDWHLM